MLFDIREHARLDKSIYEDQLAGLISIFMKPFRSAFFSRKRSLALLLVVFVIASTFVGYVSQPQSSSGPVPCPIANTSGYGVPVNAPAQIATSFSYTATASGPTGTYSTSFGGRMVELQGYLTIQVDDTKATSDQIVHLASSLGGYVAESSFDDSSSGASLVLRIPQENFTIAMQKSAALGQVKSQSTSSNDVTEQYVNLQAQLDSYKTEESALLRILNSSTTVKDALDTQNSIQYVQAQINEIEGQLRIMQRLVTFATISIQLIPPPNAPTLDFGDTLQSALLAFYVVVKGMLILGASLAPIAVVAGIAYYPYKRITARKAKPFEAKSD
jgi:hypothetical protein